MRPRWFSILTLVALAFAIALPLSAEPSATTVGSSNWLAQLGAELLDWGQATANNWFAWLRAGQEEPGGSNRPGGQSDRPGWNFLEQNTGWIDKEGCSLDPLGRPIPPCPGTGG